jgi:pyruvate dehydrogenase E2 component (dihydrolipoamide acetyltransferase)
MPELLLVPEVAAGATEVVLAEWLVAAGDTVEAGEPIAVIETDKAVVEVEAEVTGTVLRTLVDDGKTVGVGAPMALLGAAADLRGDHDAMLAALGVGAANQAPEPSAEPVTTYPAAVTPTPAVQIDRVFVSPIARKLLREADVDPARIRGSGPGGRIVRRDVEAVLAGEATTVSTNPAYAAPVAGEPWTDLPHSRLRRAIATRLTGSKQTVPHFYLKRTAVLDDLLAVRAQLNEFSPTRITVNDFLIRAVAVAHVRVPEVNVTWTDDALRRYDGVDVAIAVASPKGLVTPVLRGAEAKSLAAISAEVKEFVEAAGTGRLQQRDLEGGSISISNLGMFGIDEFAAIINPPHSAILAVGSARETPVARDGVVQAATTIQLVMSVDHRAVDGALAAQWLAALVDLLERPLQLLA